MLRIARERLRQGYRTTRFPRGAPPALPERFRRHPLVGPSRSEEGCDSCIDPCAAGAITRTPAGVLSFDLGRRLFCADWITACPSGAIGFTGDHRLATRVREHLAIGTAELHRAESLGREQRRHLGRSLRLRQVSADGLRITGPVTRNVRLALEKTHLAVPDPKIVIASGACAISGGPYSGAKEACDGVAGILRVDLFVPSCPPQPLTLLDGLLRLLGRIGQGTA